MVWMLQVNGFMVDVRHAPREVQEIAFKKGLIPYIPADRQEGMSDGEEVENAEPLHGPHRGHVSRQEMHFQGRLRAEPADR